MVENLKNRSPTVSENWQLTVYGACSDAISPLAQKTNKSVSDLTGTSHDENADRSR